MEKRRVDTPKYSPASDPVSHTEVSTAAETLPETPSVSPPAGETHPVEVASVSLNAEAAAAPATETKRDWM